MTKVTTDYDDQWLEKLSRLHAGGWMRSALCTYLLVRRGAIVLGVSNVVGAEDLLAGIALQGEEV